MGFAFNIITERNTHYRAESMSHLPKSITTVLEKEL